MHPESKDYVKLVSGDKKNKTPPLPPSPNNLQTDKKHCTSAEINSKHVPYTVKIFYKYS